MQVSREFKTGILIVLVMLFLFIGLNFLKSFGTFSDVRYFTAEFKSSEGLSTGNEVLMNGVEVGEVSSVDLEEGDATSVIVGFTVEDNEIDIPTNTELWMISSDILGTKVLDLRIPPDSLIPSDITYYQDGERFRSSYVRIAMSTEEQIEAQYLPIKSKADALVSRVQDIIVSVNAFWDTSAAYTFDASMYGVRDASYKVTEMSNNISRLVAIETQQVNKMTSNFKEVSNNFSDLSGTIKELSGNMSVVSSAFSTSQLGKLMVLLDSNMTHLQDPVLRNLKDGKGTIGKLAFTTELKDDIERTKQAIKDLSDNFGEDPGKYMGFSIFGIKAEGYQPGKDDKRTLKGLLDTLESGRKIDYGK